MPSTANQALYARYCEMAERDDKVVFMGRLGDYRYYDMDKAVARALQLAEQYFANR